MTFDPGWLKTADDLLKAVRRTRLQVNAIDNRQNIDHSAYEEDWVPYPPTAHKPLVFRLMVLEDRVDSMLRDGPFETEHDSDAILAELDQIASTAEWVMAR
jgi:hypothetical protein